MRVAVVTLAVGRVYFDRWKFQCEPGWRAYCQRHGYDLVVIDHALDTSARAQSRSPAWQKCLILGGLTQYDRVVWIDADVVINPHSPPIPDVPIEKIGVVDEAAYPTPELRQRIIKLLIEGFRNVDKRVADTWQLFLDPADWHAFCGLPRRGENIVQTGVLVLSPHHHRKLLQHVYNAYEESEKTLYEMRPLSFEIQENGLQHWIDSRFNALVYFLAWESELILNQKLSSDSQIAAALKDAYARNYFLHFGGRHDLMNLLISVNRNAPCPCASGKRYKHCHGRYA
jgi:hypothetical protein